MNIFQAMQQIKEISEELMNGCKQVTALELGMDNRVGDNLYICGDFIACTRERRGKIEYYGGFEYVDKEYVTEMGEWIIYGAGDSRISDHIARFYDWDQEETDEE